MALPYYPRIIDSELESVLSVMGAVVIEGPKWCGKTRTGLENSKSAIKLQDPDNRSRFTLMVNNKPSSLLEGETPRLIDEWQTYPVLWDAIRFAVDERGVPGQFILTGSNSPLSKEDRSEIHHSGTGRIGRIRMRPMSLFESNDSKGSVSLKDLFNGNHGFFDESPHSLKDVAFLVCRGGWPATMGMEDGQALESIRQYYLGMAGFDISEIDGVNRRADTVKRLMRSIARNTSSPVGITAISEDMADGIDGRHETVLTVRSYLNALKGLFVVEELPGWSPDMRSKVRVRSTPKRNLCDPSLAAVALGCGPDRLIDDLPTFGLLFESLCIRDLRVYSQSLKGAVYYYQDETKLEVDTIIELPDGRWGAIEIKLNPDREDKAADNLKKLVKKVDAVSMNEPSFLMVLTATGFAHRRDDGVLVVPIGCLRD